MFIIERFEGQWAVIEHGDVTFNIPRELMPDGAKEGDVLNIIIEFDSKATTEQSKKIDKLMDDLF
ncbi:MAG TPA: DUF3006 domain-containing protein [Desulfotomaculum sp.]|nr:MAG: hypothetical protein JL56_02440 [Desulfotomaculum sp. BICA1-6]HBX22558.1 DUF3006 domain-containing protein [Desulfotomaculum sp.]